MILLLSALAQAADKPKISDDTRKQLIRDFNAEAVFVKTFFPIGKVGLRIEEGVITPSEAEVRQLISNFGPAAKPGDRVRITSVRFVKKGILFELNGGPVKKKKWYERIEVSSIGGTRAPADRDPNNENLNARGSYVLLAFKDYVPDLTSAQVKDLLAPVLDFNARTQAEAYQKTLPPKLQEAIKNHHALVGMDREMVTYAKGRPPRKHREREGATDYEEWIYGEPPNDVEFIRFQGDEVVRIELMKVDGEKIVRTDREFDANAGISTLAKKEEKEEQKKTGPTLMRPGEQPAAPSGSGARLPVDGAPKEPRSPTSMPTGVPDASSGSPMPPGGGVGLPPR
ncbi:MAG TPA: hypothetical protein VN622_14430 [Clostridia bacterium]|nr:hypothetical protein [Clostridia bacterium]